MNDDGVRVTRIDWLAAIPSLRLVEAIPMAISPRIFLPMLLLMLLAGATLPLRGMDFNRLQSLQPVHNHPDLSVREFPGYPDIINTSLTRVAEGISSRSALGIVTLCWWMLMLGFCGVAAIRSAGCGFCTGMGCGVAASMRFSLQSWRAILISVSLSLILLGMLCVVFRILYITGIALLPGISAIASLIYVVGCIVLGTSWLFSIAAIAIDRCDGAEALSRGISYVLSRWLRVAVYATVYCLIMVIFNLVTRWLAEQALALAMSAYRNSDAVTQDAFRISVRSALDWLVELFHLSLFICQIAIAYVLLRNVEDGVSLREIDGGRLNLSSDRLVGTD